LYRQDENVFERLPLVIAWPRVVASRFSLFLFRMCPRADSINAYRVYISIH